MPTSAEIRARARASLQGKWTGAVLTMLLYYVLVWVLAAINMIPFLGWIVELLLIGPLAMGLYAYFLELVRTNRTDSGHLFSGFAQFIDAFLLHVLMAIFVFLWSLLLIIPGIIASLRYSQAYFILRDNPSIGPLEAIRRSKELTAGHKGRLFVLILTFIGWIILGAIPFGIGLLWVYPYILTSMAHFYEDLRSRTQAATPPPPPPGYPGYAG